MNLMTFMLFVDPCKVTMVCGDVDAARASMSDLRESAFLSAVVVALAVMTGRYSGTIR